ncbi:hypothetical protein FocnCong_v018255 [Fusarium oxysporum f. sp. conglutinans]|nr:hypothetical protein FocnCong_v018255 [Fusarium oxysporum f. sp. conglutinans]
MSRYLEMERKQTWLVQFHWCWTPDAPDHVVHKLIDCESQRQKAGHGQLEISTYRVKRCGVDNQSYAKERPSSTSSPTGARRLESPHEFEHSITAFIRGSKWNVVEKVVHRGWAWLHAGQSGLAQGSNPFQLPMKKTC